MSWTLSWLVVGMTDSCGETTFWKLVELLGITLGGTSHAYWILNSWDFSICHTWGKEICFLEAHCQTRSLFKLMKRLEYSLYWLNRSIKSVGHRKKRDGLASCGGNSDGKQAFLLLPLYLASRICNSLRWKKVERQSLSLPQSPPSFEITTKCSIITHSKICFADTWLQPANKQVRELKRQ